MNKSMNLMRVVICIFVSSVLLSGCYLPHWPYDPGDEDLPPSSRTFVFDDELYPDKKNYNGITDKQVNTSYNIYVTIATNGEKAKEDTAKDVKLYLVDETRKVVIEIGEKNITSNGYVVFPDLSYPEHAIVHLVAEGYIKKKNTSKYEYAKARSDSFKIGNPNSTIESITVSPNTHTIKVGETVEYVAKAKYKDYLPLIDVTDQVRWYSSDSGKAVMNGSVATGVGVGQTIIIASLQDKIGEATLTINAPEFYDQIIIVPNEAEIIVGQSKPFYAFGKYGDNPQEPITNLVTWSSEDQEVAVVDQNGVVTGKQSGSTMIKVTFRDKTARANLIVKSSPVTIPDSERLIWEKETVN